MSKTKPAKGKKYYTVAEANGALPLVRAIVRDITELATALRERYALRLLAQGVTPARRARTWKDRYVQRLLPARRLPAAVRGSRVRVHLRPPARRQVSAALQAGPGEVDGLRVRRTDDRQRLD